MTRSADTRTDKPVLTVVVPTRNSTATIDRCLRSVLAQTVPVEMVVVDNFSDDGTVRVAEGLGCRVISAGPERSTQRNIGAKDASAPFLLFVDSDMVLQPGAAEACLRAAGSREDVAVVLPEVAVAEGLLGRARALEKRCYGSDPHIEAARFVPKALFDRVLGYDESIYAGEDWDLHARLVRTGAQVVRADTEVEHVEGRFGLDDAFRTKLYYGRSLSRYVRKHPGLALRQLFPVRAAFVRNWRLLAAQPLTTLALIALKSVELAGIVAGLTLGPRAGR
jgi:arabinofuranan 3-O-arabinosyltransferase